MAANLTLTAARNVGWSPSIALDYPGDPLPLEGATIKMQIRLYPGQPDAPVLEAAGIPFTDGPLAPGQRRLMLTPTLSKAQLASAPSGLNKPEIGEADRFSFDIVITYPDGVQDRIAAGNFLLEPGVTTDA